jgi:hypothetical protein
MKEYHEDKWRFFQELGRKTDRENEEARIRMQVEERQRKETCEEDRQRKGERARQAKAAEEAGETKGNWPHWTQ